MPALVGSGGPILTGRFDCGIEGPSTVYDGLWRGTRLPRDKPVIRSATGGLRNRPRIAAMVMPQTKGAGTTQRDEMLARRPNSSFPNAMDVLATEARGKTPSNRHHSDSREQYAREEQDPERADEQPTDPATQLEEVPLRVRHREREAARHQRDKHPSQPRYRLRRAEPPPVRFA